MLDQNYIFILSFVKKRPLKNSRSVPGACNTSRTPLMVSLWWAQLRDGTGCVSFPVGQQGTVDTRCTLAHIPQPTPTLWQAKTEGVDALHLGRPNASSEALEPGTCFSTQVPLWPKLKQSPSSSSSPPKAIRLLHPPCSQQKAEGRGKAWLCRTPPAGNDPLCASAETPTWQKRACSMHEVRLVQPISHGYPSEIKSNSFNALDFAI